MPRLKLTMCMAESQTLLLILGMRANGCREIVTEALNVVNGVRHVEVNLYRSHAVVRHVPPCTLSDLLIAVTRAGFEATVCPARMIPRPPKPGVDQPKRPRSKNCQERPR